MGIIEQDNWTETLDTDPDYSPSAEELQALRDLIGDTEFVFSDDELAFHALRRIQAIAAYHGIVD